MIMNLNSSLICDSKHALVYSIKSLDQSLVEYSIWLKRVFVNAHPGKLKNFWAPWYIVEYPFDNECYSSSFEKWIFTMVRLKELYLLLEPVRSFALYNIVIHYNKVFS